MTKIHWENTDRASRALVEPLLEDIGIEDAEVREAVNKWAISLIEDDLLGSDLTMGELGIKIGDFGEGYSQCLADLGKREPDNGNTLRDGKQA